MTGNIDKEKCMKVVAFIGSPRAEGTTDALVRQVLNGAEDKGADTAIFPAIWI